MKKVNIIIYLLGLLVIVSLGSADREEIRAFIRHGGTSGRGRAERRGASDRRNRTDRRERGDIRDRDDRIEETGKRQDPNHICSQDPPECDGIGLAHLPLKHTLTYNLDGTWDLLLDIKNEAPRPKVSSKNVVLEGQVSLTRVSECRIRVVLQNATSSDWPIPVGTFESHIVVSSGVMQAVCGERDVSQLHPYPTSHLYSLVRSIVSASLNLSPFVDDQDDVIVENDHMGECETRYETVHLEPDVQELKRTKNLHLCVGHSGSNTKPSLHLDDKNIWECFHTYRSQEDQLVIGNSSNIETDNPRLIKITCSQFMTMSDAANFSASLNLSLANIEEWIPDGGSDGSRFHVVDFNTASFSSFAYDDASANIRHTLNKLCRSTQQAFTLESLFLYSQLVREIGKLTQDIIVQIYREISEGIICPDHQRLERLYISALRDETSSAATVAKCQLMVSRTVPVSRLWLYSLTNVNNPSAEALEACYHLLEGRHRKEATLSIAAMAGKAVQNSCLSESSRHCNFENPGCPSGTLANCKMGQAVQVVIKILASHLPRCLSRRGAKPDERLLLAIRGLGNIGSYGYNVESSLMACGGIEADETSRIAAVAAIRRGSCSMQIINWLKWQALNETEKSELRITTFQSLHHCSPEEAEAVAFLIIDKESDTQVKSYVSSYMHLGGKARDARQYSRHMVANFTSLLGLPETLLTTDVIFQNSFLPQSIGFNLSSDLLRHHGGSLQFGGRIESLEDVLQSVFGHGGSAGTPFADWLSLLLQKAQEIFRAASEDFVDKHKREKRSYSIEDVRNLLAKVKKDVSSELHGWMYAGVGGKDDFFSTFNVDPFAVDWEELFESWLEQFLESSHSFLMNSDVETTHGWCNIDDTVRTWSIFGTPISMHREEGGLFSAGANSHVSLFALITNPSSSTLNLGFSGSVGTYSVSRIQLSTSTGSIAAELSSMKTKAFDVTAVLRIQGSDNAELKIDLPQNSFQGEASQYVHSLHLPSSENNINNVVSNSEEMDNYEHANCVDIDNIDVYTSECMTLDPTDHLSFKSKRYCKTHFKGILGLSAHTKAQTMCSINAVAVKTVSYIKKSEESISGYSIGFSGKNPGINSLFLDVHIEAEGASTEQRAGIVFGLTYSPHFTIKVLLHSQQFSASGEVSVVNDPNLKRLEGHVSYGQAMYGFKGELLLVTDGGQVSIKPRLVVSYPGHLEDALLEGYIAHYSSDKVRSLTLDLYTEGTLKEYIDIAVKGTGEYKTPKGRAKIFALRNFHLSIPHFSLGLESIVSVKESSLEANIQATWNGRVIVLDGEISSLGTSLDDQQYEIVMQLLLPDFPHIDTKFMCVTKVQAAEVSNNVTLLVGEGKTQRELQVYHSTSWRITDPIPTIRTTGDQTVSLVHYDYASLAARIENKLKVACAAADLSWDINHILQMTSKSMENLVEAKIGNENHKILTNFYDQSEEFFKYYIEIEISLPAWYFSYIDTLQQQQAGDMIGRSTTVMPSGRIYTTSSRLYKSNTFDRIIFEMSYDVTVQDDEKIWKIVAHLSFDWSSEHIHLQSRAEVGGSTIFGLELALDGMASTELEFHLKNWLKSTYEVQITLSNEGRKTDLNLGMILIPLNREIKSKVALGHDGCSIGVVDGELSWDVRGDASRTVTVSSVIQLPKDGRPLELKGSLAVLSWTWKTELIADLGKDIGDSHHLNYILVLPDGSSFELGSQFGFSLGENDLSLSTVFEVQMPNEDVHNISVLVQGKLHENKIADGLLTFSVQSPITEALQFQIQAKAERNEPQHNIGVLVNAYSEGNYWEPIEAQANGKWDGTKAGVALEVAWGTVTISFDSMGSYIVADGEHHITGTSEIKLPLGKSWQQLRGALDGTFSVGQNPGRLKITHLINVEKDYAEVFNMSGEVSLHVPKAEGKLVISHAGSMARYHEYILEGTFTGKELQVEIDGIIDDIPLHVSLHYIDGQEVTIKSYYRDENYFRIEVKTQLNDVSIAIRKVKGTSYSLTTEGLLVLRGRRTRLHHDLAISPLQASSTLRLSPFLGHVFELTISRTKYSKHHCSTVILLEWGDRKFSYHDEIYFPSYSECSIKVEIDAPYFNITQVQAHVQAEADSSGEQVVQIKYLVHNDTVHSARFMYFMHGSEDEMVWRAGARDVVISSEEYNDLLVTHEIILPVGGLEMKSNMTIGVIPIVGVGVTVNLHTRALLLSVCSTSEECVRVRAHAHSRSTPSMRTYSLAAHALNSLFWSLPDDSLIQNSIIFSAQEALDKVTVSGGLRRVECSQVTCENFVVRGVLHTTVQFTDDDVEILLDTTNRTMKFKSVIRESAESEIVSASLPGGRLMKASTLESQFWINFVDDPNGMVNWTSTIVSYSSSRASEWAFRSGVYHHSLSKPLKLGGHLVTEPTSANMQVLFDVFSGVDEALKVNVKLQNDRGSYIIISNLTRSMDTHPRVADAVISFLPSPDSGQISVVLIIPTQNEKEGQLLSQNSNHVDSDVHFILTCGLDAPVEYTAFSCRLTAPSVNEKVYVRYQVVKDSGCSGLSLSVGLLHQKYHMQQKSCRNPNSFQASLSTKTKKHQRQELAVRLGVLDTKQAELDIIDAAHVMFQLHPPFLLHVMGHSRGNLWSRWEDFKNGVHLEADELKNAGVSVVESFAEDVKMLKNLARISGPTPAHHLASYLTAQSKTLLEELSGDILIKEIAQSAQMCIDVTSVLLEACMAYMNHNYGKMFMEMGSSLTAWINERVKNIKHWFVTSAAVIQDAFVTTLNFIYRVPGMILDLAMTVPVIADGARWIMKHLKVLLASSLYSNISDIGLMLGHYINWSLSLLFPGSENFNKEFTSGAWNIWIPLPECSHSLFDLWNVISSNARTSSHKLTLPSFLRQIWSLLKYPYGVINYVLPPFPAYGSIIGETHFISLDGRAFTMNSSCSHVLLADAKDKLFTLVSESHGLPERRSYTLFVGERIVKILPNLQVSADGLSITLPYVSDTISITRNLHHLTVASYDDLGRDLVTLSCLVNQQACVVGVSGWLLADTQGLLGHFNLNPADDFMRPSGQIALSAEVFSESWRLDPQCLGETTTMELPSDRRAHHLCQRLIMDFTSPMLPCQETVDVKPYYETCLRYLSSVSNQDGNTYVHQDSALDQPMTAKPNISGTLFNEDNWNLRENATSTEISEDIYHSLSFQISFRDILFPYADARSSVIDATKEELIAICNIYAAYFGVCKAKDIDISLPPICGSSSRLSYSESVSSRTREVDIVLLVDESSCDSFMYQHLISPLPEVLERIALGKNISSVKMAAIGYGSGEGDIVYHIRGPSLLTSPSQIQLSQLHGTDPPRGPLIDGLRAVSNFPFRPGSIRVALVLRCSNQDIPQFTETLPKEMIRRRLLLFTLTPDLLVFNPTRPKAVRNTIGLDRWRIYSLRHDKQRSEDSWGVRRPDSNIARLAMKSGGGVFTVTPLRDEVRSGYYMKLFRKTLSRAILKTVVNVYNHHLKVSRGQQQL